MCIDCRRSPVLGAATSEGARGGRGIVILAEESSVKSAFSLSFPPLCSFFSSWGAYVPRHCGYPARAATRAYPLATSPSFRSSRPPRCSAVRSSAARSTSELNPNPYVNRTADPADWIAHSARFVYYAHLSVSAYLSTYSLPIYRFRPLSKPGETAACLARARGCAKRIPRERRNLLPSRSGRPLFAGTS